VENDEIETAMDFTITAAYRNEDDTMTLSNEQDVSEFLALMLAQGASDPDNTCAWLYIDQRRPAERGLPDHEMRVGVLADISAWTLGFTDVRGSMYVKGRDNGQDEVRLFSQGSDESFPSDALVDADTVKSAILETLRTGERPENVAWADIR
jgi:hypothetical protein